MKKPITSLTRNDVELYDKTRSQMDKLSQDFENLSKKTPDAPISKFKLNFVNEQLEAANKLLLDKFKPIKDFMLFDEALLPSNSDVLLVLNQYLTCLEKWRSSNVSFTTDPTTRSSAWTWNLGGDRIVSSSPSSQVFRTDRSE